MSDLPFASPYVPNTDEDRIAMLAAIGVSSVDDLFVDIPTEFRDPALRIPAPMSEMDLRQEMARLRQLMHEQTR